MDQSTDIDSLIAALKDVDGRLRGFLEEWDGTAVLTDFLAIWYNGLLALGIATFTDARPLGMAFARKGLTLDASRMAIMSMKAPASDGTRAQYVVILNNCTALISDMQYLLSFVQLGFSDSELPLPAKMLVLNARKGIENLLLALMNKYTEERLVSVGAFSVPAIKA